MSETKVRRRTVKARALPDVGEGVVECYPTVFGVPYNVGFGFKEQLEVGAFDESLETKPALPIFWMHSWEEGLLIGDGTGAADEKGVKVTSQLYVDDDLGKRCWRAMKSGAIDEWSIAFIAEAWELDEDDEMLEHVTKARLIEASSVVLGANPETETIDVRKRSLVIPLLEDGQIRYVPVEEFAEAPRSRRQTEPAPPAPPAPPSKTPELDEVPAERLRLLDRPAVRDLYREQASSTPVASET